MSGGQPAAHRIVLGAFLFLGVIGATGSLALPANASPVRPVQSCAATWPTYQHDAAHTAAGCGTLSPVAAATLRPAWFTSTSGAVTAEPIVDGGAVYVGDSDGAFHALNESSGKSLWTFNDTVAHSCALDRPNPYVDHHDGGADAFVSSAAFSPTIGADPGHGEDATVFVAGGAALFALNAVTGACDWAQDIDPGNPASNVEIESSPVVDTSVSPAEVIIGSDDNSGAGRDVTGIQAFDATTGGLLWRYEPERDVTLYPSEFGGSDALTLSCGDASLNWYCNDVNVPGIAPNLLAWADACGDVWSSPVLDTSFIDPAGDNAYQSFGEQAITDPVWQPKQITATGRPSRDGLVMFGTGNCAANPTPATTFAHDDYAHTDGEFSLDPVTGVRLWDFFEPPNLYNTDNPNEVGGGDDDFGSSAVLATVPDSDFPPDTDPCPTFWGGTSLVIQGSKSGYAYGICEVTGKEIWAVQASQAGQLGPALVGAVGGYIGSPALGVSSGRPTAFFDAAIPLPFVDEGVHVPGTPPEVGAVCPVAPLLAEQLPACPDLSLLNDPARLFSVQAVDAATGKIDWRTPGGPSYGAATYSNGVVFAASTTTFSVGAYDADNGLPLWRFPLGAALASGVSPVGPGLFVGSGLAEKSVNGVTVPPGLNGVWSFTTGALVPGINSSP